MTIKDLIINNIIDDIYIYKEIYNNYIEFIREDIKSDYDPSFNFDGFCVKFIDNFEGVYLNSDNLLGEYDYYNLKKIPLTKRSMMSIFKIAFDEFKDDVDSTNKLKDIQEKEL